MKILKRDGSEVEFNRQKIEIAIQKANQSIDSKNRIKNSDIKEIADKVELDLTKAITIASVEDIQDIVEDCLVKKNAYELVKSYILYRYEHAQDREESTFDSKMLGIINQANEEVMQENANKNPKILSTQRDYSAGEVSKRIARKYVFSKESIELHDKGIIHIHDLDYRGFKSTNCCLVNLDDMLQNGTVISKTKIDKPHLFSTACNVTTQIMAQVASGQYGGSSYNMYHLAKFVDVSRQKFRKETIELLSESGLEYTDEQLNTIVESKVKADIRRGIQTIQYQILTLMTTNGQTPFVSLFIWLNEAETPKLKKDYAMVIEELLKQRIQGIKNDKGAWIAPTFPKILYTISENNITPDGEYFYLTKLAAECTAKRMVPDYISEKKMRELKEDNVYGCMGCAEGNELVTYKLDNMLYVESIKRMWNRISLKLGYSNVKGQRFSDDKNRFINTSFIDLKIFDSVKNDFVKVNQMNRNISSKWLTVQLSNGRIVDVTDDHPFTTDEKDIVHARDLKPGMKIKCDYNQYSENNYSLDPKYTWLLGMFLADGCYNHQLSVTIDSETENDIEKAFLERTKEFFNMNFATKLHDRGEKGRYKELYVNSIVDPKSAKEQKILRNDLLKMFGGMEKTSRHIYGNIFECDYESRLGLLAGLIDADGYIHPHSNIVMMGSTNKELALQQLALAQSCGMKAKMSHNYYRSNRRDKVRYSVTFYPNEDLLNMIVSEKKRNNANLSKNFKTIDNVNDIQYNEVVSVVENLRVLNDEGWQYSYDVTTESEHFTLSGIYSHNCRSFLAPWKDPETGKYKFWGRLNTGVVTINLPHVALEMKEENPNWDMHNPEDVKAFYEKFDHYLEYCHRALLEGHKWLEGTKATVSPILWQHGALARLKPNETIDSKIFNGYSSSSLGYVGLHETLMALTGKSHTASEENKQFALEIAKHMNLKCQEWNNIPGQNHGFSLYGTPEESTTYKFSKSLRKLHGVVKGITDKNYVTNSYHWPVTEGLEDGVTPFVKLGFESEFQQYTTGGAISYVEAPNMINNIEAVITVIRFIYDHIMYAELNCKLDYCHTCGGYGTIEMIKNKDGKFIWKCHNCGEEDPENIDVSVRVCGYISSANTINQGRMEEIDSRKKHM